MALAAEGAAMAVVARTEQVWDVRLPGTIGETVAEIEAAGGHVVAIRADLLDRDDISRLVDEARAALGPITSWSTMPHSPCLAARRNPLCR